MVSKITYVRTDTVSDWKHFQWSVSINGVNFTYRTGLGHATLKAKTDRQGYFLGYNKKPASPTQYVTDDTGKYWVHVPKIDDILECLFSDADAGSVSFNEFCDTFGYSNDSLKALDTYRACMQAASDLKTALGREYHSEKSRIEAKNAS